jgi:hypothetical protein
MGMMFQTFLEFADARIRAGNEASLEQQKSDPSLRENGRFNPIPPLSKSHIFHMGEDEKLVEATVALGSELDLDMEYGVPLPFGDVAAVSKVGPGWIMDRILLGHSPWENLRYEDVRYDDVSDGFAQKCKQPLYVVRIEEGGLPVPIHFGAMFWGARGNEMCISLSTPSELMERWAIKELPIILRQMTLISHPENYVIQVTPRLTAHEERRVAGGKARPIAKSPHYVVVDHDVLVQMSRREPVHTHASPVPHHRRGHWMRLAERCTYARLMGKERVFVKPAYVGQRTFEDEKAKYIVLLDFNKEKLEAIK